MNTTPSIPNENDLRKDSLRARYLECLGALRTNTTSFRQTVCRLIELGVHRADLVAWAVDAGYSESHIRNLLTRLFSEQGMRIRRPGAGRRTPPEALAILATARNEHGDQAVKFLRAAVRAAEAEASAKRSPKPILLIL